MCQCCLQKWHPCAFVVQSGIELSQLPYMGQHVTAHDSRRTPSRQRRLRRRPAPRPRRRRRPAAAAARPPSSSRTCRGARRRTPFAASSSRPARSPTSASVRRCCDLSAGCTLCMLMHTGFLVRTCKRAVGAGQLRPESPITLGAQWASVFLGSAMLLGCCMLRLRAMPLHLHLHQACL